MQNYSNTYTQQKLNQIESSKKVIKDFEERPELNLSHVISFLHLVQDTIQFEETKLPENVCKNLKSYASKIEKLQNKRISKQTYYSNKDVEIYGRLYAIKQLLK